MTSLRPAPGRLDLTTIATDDAPGFDGGKAAGAAALADLGPELADLQERLFANRDDARRRRVLLVLQGMDTSGKGGVLRHTVGLVDPQGVRIRSFKAPTEEEKRHHFLWRIEQALPEPGYVGVFDRSHYEDVLIHRVRGWADEATIQQRYADINGFETRLVDDGCVVVKCMLHISADEQKARLRERLDNPEKHWKYNPGDLDERALWPAYRDAYERAIEATNSEAAPWFVVPSDKKWFRNLAIGRLLLDALRGLELRWPAADFDVAVEQRRLAEEEPVR